MFDSALCVEVAVSCTLGGIFHNMLIGSHRIPVLGTQDDCLMVHSPLIPSAVPLRGDLSCGQSTMTRFYSLHTFVFPFLSLVLLSSHFVMIRKQGILGPL